MDPFANPNCSRCEGTGWYHPFAPDDTFGPEVQCPCVPWEDDDDDDEQESDDDA
jgi:hypothetical protein